MKTSIAMLALLLSIQAVPAAFAAEPGDKARSLFVQQLKKPTAKVNNGVSYWLELNRDGKNSRVSNKHQFVDGDQMSLHVKTNFDGYVYVLQMKGSKNDKAVLFPSKAVHSPKVKANTAIDLPGGKERFEFDETPGLETIRIIVSRKPIDPQKELDAGGAVTIAAPGSQATDSVPQGTLVSIMLAPNATVQTAVASKSMFIAPAKTPEAEGEVTVVSSDVNKPLTVDLALTHGKAGG